MVKCNVENHKNGILSLNIEGKYVILSTIPYPDKTNACAKFAACVRSAVSDDIDRRRI